jgi:hypothetical protein
MNAVCAPRRQAVGALCGLLLTLPFAVCAATAGFHVAVQMGSTSQGSCASGPLTNTADFQVTCTSGQFVSISPWPVQPFVGTPGSAYRYYMVRSAPDPERSTRFPVSREPPLPATAMRVSSGPGLSAGPVEILVSF